STPVTVDVETQDSSATAGDDYDAVDPEILTFAPGDTSIEVPVTVHGDTLDEGDAEYLVLHLFNGVGADLGFEDGTETFANGIIYDDDNPGPGAFRLSNAAASIG